MVDNITYVKDGDLSSDLLRRIVLIIVIMFENKFLKNFKTDKTVYSQRAPQSSLLRVTVF